MSRKLQRFIAEHMHTERPVLEALVEAEITAREMIKKEGKYTRALRHMLAYLRSPGERPEGCKNKVFRHFAPLANDWVKRGVHKAEALAVFKGVLDG